MIFVCGNCGMTNCFTVEGDLQVCKNCGNRRKIRKGRLLLLIGPQGAGKTAVSEALQRKTAWLVLEGDILRPSGLPSWRKERQYLKTWLKICTEAAQTIDTVVLCGNWSPTMIASCSELSYFFEPVLVVLFPSLRFMTENQEKRPSYRKVSRLLLIRQLHRRLDRRRYLRTDAFRGTVLRLDQPLGSPEDTADCIISKMARTKTDRPDERGD